MRICVFCGSNTGFDPIHMKAAKELGELIAKSGYGVVYGGAKDGLMGAVADGALECDGEVIGVLPQQLSDLEVAHTDLTELYIVPNMHERKQKMHDLSDAFICMPGGIGTMEETFEVWTWSQLGVHRKALALYNVNGFFDSLEAFLDTMVNEGFVRDVHRQMLLKGEDPEKLIKDLMAYEPPLVKKWISAEDR